MPIAFFQIVFQELLSQTAFFDVGLRSFDGKPFRIIYFIRYAIKALVRDDTKTTRKLDIRKNECSLLGLGFWVTTWFPFYCADSQMAFMFSNVCWVEFSSILSVTSLSRIFVNSVSGGTLSISNVSSVPPSLAT